MSSSDFFAGGIPGETYCEGVRRRVRTAGIIGGLTLAGAGLSYGVFSFTGSVWATLVMAMLCGIALSRADVRVDPVTGNAPKRSEKRIWLFLFVPALVALGAASIYAGLHAESALNVFRAALSAGLFGWVLGFTAFILPGADSRVHA